MVVKKDVKKCVGSRIYKDLLMVVGSWIYGFLCFSCFVACAFFGFLFLYNIVFLPRFSFIIFIGLFISMMIFGHIYFMCYLEIKND